jgi:hypothetical protein
LLKYQLFEHVKLEHSAEFEDSFILKEEEKKEQEALKERKDFKDEEINDKGDKAIRYKGNNKYYCGKDITHTHDGKVAGFPKICEGKEAGTINCYCCMKLDLEANDAQTC